VLDQLIERVGSDRPIRSTDFGEIGSFLLADGGISIGNGLLRIHSVDSAQAADGFVREAFPDFHHRVRCFAFDWLGRQFSLDSASADGPRSATILMFEAGTGEALEIPVRLNEFFQHEIVDYSDAALAETAFTAWQASGGAAPAFTESIGYRTPLFLGGLDEISNLELTDTAEYWGIFGQLLVRAIGLPPGTRIDAVTIEKPPTNG